MSSNVALPATFKKLVVKKVTQKFREAVEVVSSPMLTPGPGQLLIKNRYVGINASDINFTACRYFLLNTLPPFDCGFEGIGQVVAVGADCKRTKVGQAVGYQERGAFAEYVLVDEKAAFPLPSEKAEYLSLLVSGLTAAISLDKVAQLQPNDVVLVTAAAGGTGQFAVQWAKQQGCHVIGLCSSADKVQFLRSIGCDRPINSSTENLDAVLKAEFPKGVDAVYECIGGEVFETCLNNLATRGRIVIIGFISGYEGDKGQPALKLDTPGLLARLLTRSQSLRGFIMRDYREDCPEYGMKLIRMLDEGKLRSVVDLGQNNAAGKFRGMESVADAVDYMYARKNVGKIVVEV